MRRFFTWFKTRMLGIGGMPEGYELETNGIHWRYAMAGYSSSTEFHTRRGAVAFAWRVYDNIERTKRRTWRRVEQETHEV